MIYSSEFYELFAFDLTFFFISLCFIMLNDLVLNQAFCLKELSANLMNLSRVSNPPKNLF